MTLLERFELLAPKHSKHETLQSRRIVEILLGPDKSNLRLKKTRQRQKVY